LPTGAIGVFVGATVIGCVVVGGVSVVGAGFTTEVNVVGATGFVTVAGVDIVGIVVVSFVGLTGLSVPTGATGGVSLIAVNPPTGACGGGFGVCFGKYSKPPDVVEMLVFSFGPKLPTGAVGFGFTVPTGTVGFLGAGFGFGRGGGGGANSFLIAAVVAAVRVLEITLPIGVCFNGVAVGEGFVG
jgi:hypothetical protein